MKKKGLTHLIATDRAYLGGITKATGTTSYCEKDKLYICQNPKFNEEAEQYRNIGGTFYQPQHLYITTDEEIKEGDEGKYVIGTYSNFVTLDRIKKVHNLGKTSILLESSVDVTPNILQIIVATDNPELWYEEKCKIGPHTSKHYACEFAHKTSEKCLCLTDIPLIAKISLSFLKEYVEKQPKEVWLNYIQLPYNKNNGSFNRNADNYVPEFNSDGSVIISPVEEWVYTRLELKNALYDVKFLCPKWYDENFDEWFNRNYPQ